MHVNLNGQQPVYAATGGHEFDPEKETVVFIHGVGQDHTVWVLPTRYFARHDRNVVAVDLPGHGRSGGDPLPTLEAMADWIVAVLDEMGVERAALVGHSMGSLIALDAGARYRHRVRAVVMVGVAVPLAVAEPLMVSAAENSHDAIDMLTYWSFSNRAQIGGNPTPGVWMAGRTQRLLERMAPGLIHTDLMACDGYAAGLDRAAELECPTLLLLGEKDRLTPVKLTETLRAKLPDQNTVIFEGAGHSLLSERPDQVLDELIRFV